MKLTFLSFISSVVLLYSCSSSKTQDEKLVGTWTGDLIEVTDKGTISGTVSTILNSDHSYTQHADMSVNNANMSITSSGNWEVQGKYFIMHIKEHSMPIVAPQNMVYTSEILELNDNTLILEEDGYGKVTYKKK